MKKCRLCSIYLVYKSGEASDPMNYKPIALLNTSYKIFTSLLNYRFSRFLENTNSFSCMQGGFRIGRTTFTKIWTLINMFEDAKINKKPLHVCYIDVKKAYDSVEQIGRAHV